MDEEVDPDSSGVRLHRDDSGDRKKVTFTPWEMEAVLHLNI